MIFWVAKEIIRILYVNKYLHLCTMNKILIKNQIMYIYYNYKVKLLIKIKYTRYENKNF